MTCIILRSFWFMRWVTLHALIGCVMAPDHFGKDMSTDTSLLGLETYTFTHVKNITEIFKIIDRNYHQFCETELSPNMDAMIEKQAFNSILPAGASKTVIYRLKVLLKNQIMKFPRLHAEIKYMALRAIRGQHLTELFSLFFVKYTALVYAVQFHHGYNLIRTNFIMKQNYQDIACSLAVFSVSSTSHIFEAIKRILKEKGDGSVEIFSKMARSFLSMVEIISQYIIFRNYDREVDDVFYEIDDFIDNLKSLQSYFRTAIYGEPDDSTKAYIYNLNGDEHIWKWAQWILDMLKMETGTMYNDWDDNSKGMNRSMVIKILRNLEMFRVVQKLKFENDLQKRNIMRGYKDSFYVLKLYLTESGISLKYHSRPYLSLIETEKLKQN